MSKSSAQVNSGNVVTGILNDSLGRVPEGNIPLDIENAESILGYKYDESAEEVNDKTCQVLQHQVKINTLMNMVLNKIYQHNET